MQKAFSRNSLGRLHFRLVYSKYYFKQGPVTNRAANAGFVEQYFKDLMFDSSKVLQIVDSSSYFALKVLIELFSSVYIIIAFLKHEYLPIFSLFFSSESRKMFHSAERKNCSTAPPSAQSAMDRRYRATSPTYTNSIMQ